MGSLEYRDPRASAVPIATEGTHCASKLRFRIELNAAALSERLVTDGCELGTFFSCGQYGTRRDGATCAVSADHLPRKTQRCRIELRFGVIGYGRGAREMKNDAVFAKWEKIV